MKLRQMVNLTLESAERMLWDGRIRQIDFDRFYYVWLWSAFRMESDEQFIYQKERKSLYDLGQRIDRTKRRVERLRKGV